MECVWKVQITITGLGTSANTGAYEAVLVISTGNSANYATQWLTGGSNYNVFAITTHIGTQQTFYLKDTNASTAQPYVKLSVFRPGAGMQVYGDASSRLSTASTFTYTCSCSKIGTCVDNKIINMKYIAEMYPIINTYFGTGGMYRTFIGIPWGGYSGVLASITRMVSNSYSNKFIAVKNGTVVSDSKYYVPWRNIAMQSISSGNIFTYHPGYTLSKSGNPTIKIANNISTGITVMYAYVSVKDSLNSQTYSNWIKLTQNPNVSAGQTINATATVGSTVDYAYYLDVTVIGFMQCSPSNQKLTISLFGESNTYTIQYSNFSFQYTQTMTGAQTVSGTAMSLTFHT